MSYKSIGGLERKKLKGFPNEMWILFYWYRKG